jgi:hemerythrin-like domain-containing protein
MTLPSVLAPLGEDRRRLEAVLELLEETSEPEVRADLADEAIRLCARYEDVMERAVYPMLRKDNRPQVDRAEREQRQVRAAMRDMRARTRHVQPIDAHASDPEGFEQSLDELIDVIRTSLAREDQDLLPMAGRLDADAQAELHNQVERTLAHASTHPDPPRNRIGHALASVMDKVDRTIRDSSTTWHPGLELLNEHESDPADP